MNLRWPKIVKVLIYTLALTVNPRSGEVQGAYEPPQHKIRCNDAYCNEPGQGIVCPPDPPVCETIGYRKMLNPIRCNCCPYCFDYLKEGDSCNTKSNGAPNHMCGPQLQCKDDGTGTAFCTTMVNPGMCSERLAEYLKRQEDGTGGIADWHPHCTAHGRYAARQCLPASSVCICMSPDGDGIFGMGLAKDIMDCACSKDMGRLESFGVMREGSHCMPNGDYDNLQCSLRKRYCYCRHKPSAKVNFNKIKDLPCYDPAIHTETYVRPCELARGELDGLVYDSEDNGTAILIGDFPRCSPDGNYAAIQSKGTSWICVDSNGNQIDSYGVPRSATSVIDPPAAMTCLCARIRNFLGQNTGKPSCCPSGNFRAWQCTGSTCYCVDQLGRQEINPIHEVPREDVELLTCYSTACPPL